MGSRGSALLTDYLVNWRKMSPEVVIWSDGEGLRTTSHEKAGNISSRECSAQRHVRTVLLVPIVFVPT